MLPEYSTFVLGMKNNVLHPYGAHSSLASVTHNFTIEGNQYSASYLDTSPAFLNTINLFLAIDFLIRYLEVLNKHAGTVGLITPEDFPAKVAGLRAELERLKAKHEPDFRAWQKKQQGKQGEGTPA
jgi:hypothetical protein